MADGQTSLWVQLGTVVVSFLSGAAIAVFADPIRRYLYRPRIQVTFAKSDDPAFVARTPAVSTLPKGADPLHYDGFEVHPTTDGRLLVEHQAVYIRCLVRNKRGMVAKGCRAYLVKVEQAAAGGRFGPAVFYDSVQLAWASRPGHQYEAVDLPRGVPQYVDVVSTRDFNPNPECPPEPIPRFQIESQFKPFRESGLGTKPGTFRFTILVAGDNFPPFEFRLGLRWNGQWDQIEAWKV